MNLHETEVSSQPIPRGGGLKFAYPSGSRPLEGYTIKRGIGRGGFGEVYYATSDGGKEVALKLIRRNLDVEIRGVSQCLNLKHPNLVTLYDIKRDDQDDSWVVMEYVAGECLEAVIAAHPSGMPTAELLSWFAGVVAGVAYLHDKGVVHRDLKPGNIFSDEGLVKIGDYGLSKFISASRRSGQTESVGTVHYMAPEVSNGRYGKEIDIYALGIMLYEMLTGRVPFEGESVGEVLMKHLTAQPDLSGLSEPYRAVVARALAKDPEQRFKSVTELLAALPAAGMNAKAAGPHVQLPIVGSPHAAVAVHEPVRHPAKAAAAPARTPAVVDEEPLWRATREAWRQMNEAWTRANFSTPTKILLLLGGIFIVLQAWAVTVPAIVCGTIVYGSYRIVRAILLTRAGPTIAAAAPRNNAAPPPPAASAPHVEPPVLTVAANGGTSPFRAVADAGPHRRRIAWKEREQSVPALLLKNRRERFSELLGSMLLGAGVAVAVSVVMSLILKDGMAPEQFAWLSIVSTAGSWAILIPAKFWEGTQGEPILRRFVLLLSGLALGVVAYGLDQALLVDLPWAVNMRLPNVDRYPTLFSETGAPWLNGYLAYFGFLFPLLRWWKSADPVRSTRLSLWSVMVPVFWAWLLGAFWPFPQPWGVMVAATVAISVQLASPWANTRRRTAADVA